MSGSKFWKGVLLGAVVGGALSLFDRQTRTTVVGNCLKTKEKITYYAKHPDEAAQCMTESARKIRSTIEEVGEDISFITEKVEELRELTPQMVDIVKDTKDVLLDPDEGSDKTFM
ncbi:YtxH domain-containing protein [Bacillus benzoevorans]|uniref:Gas vesicle protein n=1 Tax=Bacillus benzoevorans TaxID=1456 RepID=A0A7X0HV10_9BACI|nr:YtxH domain-containing protein [Bacillus benzoevorans]MBB6447354.1 gas vesicle protein [Bacillus benzoevorans]